MNFPCFVCEKVFFRSQDRTAHLNQKKDTAHQSYTRNQAQKLTARFSDAIQAASVDVRTSTDHYTQQLLSIESNDVDRDDLPSSRDMNIDPEDPDSLSDLEGSIVSSFEDPVAEHEDQYDGDVLRKAFWDATSALEDLQLDENEAKFDFLPAPGLDMDVPEEQEDPEPTDAVHPRAPLGRILDDDESEPHTWRWHQSAGKVYRREESVYQEWKRIFSENEENGKEGYQPFHSQLDWEVAQWALKNKIGQGALDCFL